MITIGSVRSAPHAYNLRELYSYQMCLPFLYSSGPLHAARTATATPTIIHQSTQIFSGSAFWGVEICNENFSVKFAPKN
jgi:hypothetical protein